MLRKQTVHPAVTADNCGDCHRPAAKAGKCRSKASSGWALTKDQPDLCHECHQPKDTAKEVHTAVRVGACLECHDAHASDLPALAKKPREQLCFGCHGLDSLFSRAVKHPPVAEGRCLECHDPHGSDRPKALRATGKALCLRCHAETAPTGRGMPGPAYRVDLKKPLVHKPVRDGECADCHEVGHAGENLKLLKKVPPDLCYGCHQRQDGQKQVHGAVLAGDCTVCHEPHSSSSPKLLAKDTQKDLCFVCHQDDLSGRAALHAPVAQGKCLECHGAHGAPNRNNLVKGDGKQACYACHKALDDGKVKHAALERYGCTGCHDPHGTANPVLLAKPVNALCITCHPDRPDGRHVTSMLAAGHVVSGLLDPRRPGRKFSCASCHNPHGSDHPRLFYLGDNAFESCDGCHGNRSGKHPGAKSIISGSRPGPSVPAGGSGGGGGADAPGDRPAAPPAAGAAPSPSGAEKAPRP